MSETYVIVQHTLSNGAESARPTLLRGVDRIAAMQTMEAQAKLLYGTRLGSAKGNAHVRSFIEGASDHAVLGAFRLDAIKENA